MIINPIIKILINHKSIRKYKKKQPTDAEIETIVKAGQQAPFSYQLCSLLLTRKRENIPFEAPLLFTICVDSYRLELVMKQRNWKMKMNDLSLLFFGIQDAAYQAQNMVVASESLGLGSCFLGNTPYIADKIVKEYKLPKRVFPIVQLAMGYPDEDPPPRPRFPIEFSLFENTYPNPDLKTIKKAMQKMDQGYLSQDYYRNANYIIPLQDNREETFNFNNYSWTEHISRKAGQWLDSPSDLLEQFHKCGFNLKF